NLPPNFNRPYAATSISDFWRRWHMTLSSWLRDYLYISLGGNRMKTRWGVYRNLIITMFLGGLWHGAAWHFAIWGVLHGVWLSLERACGVERSAAGSPQISTAARLVRIFLVFHGVLLLWLMFRSESMSALGSMIWTMTHYTPGPVTRGMALVVVVALAMWAWQVVNDTVDVKARFLALPIPAKVGAYVAAAYC